MEVPAIRVTQGGRTLYLTSLTAGQLIEACVPDEWNPALGFDAAVQGYQREPRPDHVANIASYLANTASVFMPNGALLTARESHYGILPFKEIAQAGGQVGTLTIPDHRPLYLVDYQHRWKGFARAIEVLGHDDLKNFQVPVTIIADIPRPSEIEQFYVINSKQRRIDTDLGLALIQTLAEDYPEAALLELVGKGKRFRVRGTRLAFKLASAAGGP
jgi:DGQHR domain-containing protein